MKRFVVPLTALGCIVLLGTTYTRNASASDWLNNSQISRPLDSRSNAQITSAVADQNIAFSATPRYRVVYGDSTTTLRQSEPRANYRLLPLITFLGLLGILSAFAVRQTAPLLLYISGRRVRDSEAL